jgi:peptide/nickel transport system ATP-binding protein
MADLEIRVGSRPLVHGVSLSWSAAERVALLGASGSGKTLTARALVGLVDLEPGVVSGELQVRAEDGTVHRPYASVPATRAARDCAFQPLRGRVLGYMPQHARSALDPLRRVGAQIRGDAPGWLARVGLHAAVATSWPHELSGGMATRALLAAVLASGASLLVCDEPTTGLDPVARVLVLDVLRDLSESGIGVLLVTHELRQAAAWAHSAVVLHQGGVAETLDGAALRAGAVGSTAARRLVDAAGLAP